MDKRGKVYFVACVNDSQCGDNAFCTAIGQNHTCLCNSGFLGNGVVCHGMETRLRPVEVLHFFSLLYVITKIAFITARIIASFNFISAVQYIHVSFHSLVWKLFHNHVTLLNQSPVSC